MIELGVAKGEFGEALMLTNPDARYLGIDRYTDHHGEGECRSTMLRLGKLGGSLWRITFAEAARHIRPGSVDLVYVDGYAHTGQDGGLTLTEWWPKVKPGGIFAGHDYHPRWQPTIDAVNAFARAYGLEQDLRLIHEEKGYDSWWIRKPFDSASVA